jgi:acyl carrier protein
LPDYMVPAAFIILDALPLTPNGKIDRKRLPQPSRSDFGGGFGAELPRTSLEEEMLAIWISELGIEQISIQDNFFQIGGHSLLSTQLISRVRKKFKVPDLPLRALFAYPTIVSLTAFVEEAVRENNRCMATTPSVPLDRSR